jgi:nitroreductase
MPDAVDVFEGIHTARMRRVLKPDPVPDALTQRILAAAVCAPSADNAQAWSFIAVTDETQRRRLGECARADGYPSGPVRRKPLAEVACRDRFGTPWTPAG